MATRRRAALRPVAAPVDTFVSGQRPFTPNQTISNATIVGLSRLSRALRESYNAETAEMTEQAASEAASFMQHATPESVKLFSMPGEEGVKQITRAFTDAGYTDLNPLKIQALRKLAGQAWVRNQEYQKQLTSEYLDKVTDPHYSGNAEDDLRKIRESHLETLGPEVPMSFQQGVMVEMAKREQEVRSQIPGKRNKKAAEDTKVHMVGVVEGLVVNELVAAIGNGSPPNIERLTEAYQRAQLEFAEQHSLGEARMGEFISEGLRNGLKEVEARYGADIALHMVDMLRQGEFIKGVKVGSGDSGSLLNDMERSFTAERDQDDFKQQQQFRNWVRGSATPVMLEAGDRPSERQQAIIEQIPTWKARAAELGLDYETAIAGTVDELLNQAKRTAPMESDPQVARGIELAMARREYGAAQALLDAGIENLSTADAARFTRELTDAPRQAQASADEAIGRSWRALNSSSAREQVFRDNPKLVVERDEMFDQARQQALQDVSKDKELVLGTPLWQSAVNTRFKELVTSNPLWEKVDALGVELLPKALRGHEAFQDTRKILKSVAQARFPQVRFETSETTRRTIPTGGDPEQMQLFREVMRTWNEKEEGIIQEEYKQGLALGRSQVATMNAISDRLANTLPDFWDTVENPTDDQLQSQGFEERFKDQSEKNVQLHSNPQRLGEVLEANPPSYRPSQIDEGGIFAVSGAYSQFQLGGRDYRKGLQALLSNPGPGMTNEIVAQVSQGMTAALEPSFNFGGQGPSNLKLNRAILAKALKGNLKYESGKRVHVTGRQTDPVRDIQLALPKSREGRIQMARGILEFTGVSETALHSGKTQDGFQLKEVWGTQWGSKFPWSIVPIFATSGELSQFHTRLKNGDEKALKTLKILNIDASNEEHVERFYKTQKRIVLLREKALPALYQTDHHSGLDKDAMLKWIRTPKLLTPKQEKSGKTRFTDF